MNDQVKPVLLHKMKFKKILLWGLLIINFIVSSSILGIIGLWFAGELKFNDSKRQEKKVENSSVSLAAQSFAIEFANEYFEWIIGEEEKRAERLRSYLAIGIDEQAGVNFSSQSYNSQPKQISVWNIEPKGENKSVITLSVQVTFYNPKNEEDFFDRKQLLAVPLLALGQNRFVVSNTPYIVPSPHKGSVQKDAELRMGDSVDEKEKAQIKEALQNFFKVYSSGKDSEISYLTKTSKPIHGYHGKMWFVDLEDGFEVVKNREDYIVYPIVEFQDRKAEVSYKFPLEVKLRKEGNQWFVTELGHQH